MPLGFEARDTDVMADEYRRRAPGQRAADAAEPESADVALPEHASAYFSPRPPPSSTSHQTIETEAIRLDPAIDPDTAVTQQMKVGGLSPPPWLGQPLPRSDAPTVLVPIVKARRRRQRVAGLAALVGVLAGIAYGVTRPISPRQPAAPAQQPPVSVLRTTARPAPVPPPVATQVEPRAAAQSAAPLASAAGETEKSTQPSTHPSPTSRVQVGTRRPRPSSSAPSAWLKSEPPKAWFK